MKILCILACVLGILLPTVADSICKADLGLVVDTTKSLGREEDVLPDLREVLAHLVQKFDISRDKTHVSLETFCKPAKVHNSFNDSNFWSVNAVTGFINNTITDLKSCTRLDNALEKANSKMFTEGNGDRSGEVSALVLFSDGKNFPGHNEIKLKSALEGLKNKGVIVIAVGIGQKSKKPVNQDMLKQIAGENVIYLHDYKTGLDEKMDAVVNLVCICKPNLGLVVDTTKSLRGNGSINDSTVLDALKKALTYFVKKFDISEDKTHVSLETFTGKGNVHNKFNDSSFWSLDAIIKLINYNIKDLNSPTLLDEALKKANRSMFTEASGYSSEELNVLVVFTDGRNNKNRFDEDKFASSIKDLKDKGVHLYAVGIGPDSGRTESQNKLEQIARTVSYVPDFVHNHEAMENALNDVFDKICGLPRTGRISALA